ncbi:MAG: phytanoyl-CoA dioxygenase family protein [Spirochaetaceae bacterium]
MVHKIVFEKSIPDHDADLYTSHGNFAPLIGWDSIGPEARAQYDRDGFLVVQQAIPDSMVADALTELQSMCRSDDPDCVNVAYEGAMRERVESILGTSFDDAEPEQRAAAISAIPAHERAALVRKFMGFTRTHKPLAAVANYRPLRDTIELLAGEPTRIFQAMALVKPPFGREKPWHQDHAYFDLPIDSRICGVWIALGTVTPENGAMFMLRGGHAGGPIVHFKRRDWQICDTEIAGKQPVALPMNPGDLVIFDAKIPHGTPKNTTDQQRWALQFHYVPRSVEKVAEAQRLAIFGEEGKDVSC